MEHLRRSPTAVDDAPIALVVPDKRSKLLGIVRYSDGSRAALAQFVGSDLDKFRLVPVDEFRADWRPAPGMELPGWAEIARAAN